MIRKQRVPLFQMLTIGMLPSWLKVWYYRMRGARIGKNVSIGIFAVIIANELEIGDGTQIGFATIIRGREVRLRRHVKIGAMTFLDVERISIDDDTKINERVFAGGPMLPESALIVGKNCIIMQYTFLNTTKPLTIGDGTGVGGHCLLFTHGSWQSELDGYPVTFAPVTLGKNVWLPWRVFVLPGVTVGDNVTIGANSLVTRSIPAGSLAAGMPAQILRSAPDYPRQLAEEDRRARLDRIIDEFLRYIEYHGHAVSKTLTGTGSEITISGREQFRLVVCADRIVQADLIRSDAHTVILSLSGFPAPPCGNNGAMWIDIAKSQRVGSNELGEELVLFLSRYGIRFYRAD